MKSIRLSALAFLIIDVVTILGKQTQVRIGLLIPTTWDAGQVERVEKAFVDFNTQKILQESKLFLHPELAYVSHNDTFLTSKSVCHLIEKHCMMVYGANLNNLGEISASTLNFFGIPFVQSNPSLLWNHQHHQFETSMNLFPKRSTLSSAILDIVKHLNLSHLVVIYHEEMEALLWKHFIDSESKRRLVIPKFIFIDKDNLKYELMSILLRLKTTTSNIVHLNFHDGTLSEDFLHCCQVSGFMNPSTNIILTNLGLNPIVLDPYKHIGSNITFIHMSQSDASNEPTALALLDENSVEHEVKDVEDEQDYFHGFLLDALMLFSKALRLSMVERFPRNLSCQGTEFWRRGKYLAEVMKKTQFLGVTGHLKMDGSGERSDFSLEISQLTQASVETKGTWAPKNGLMWSKRLSGYINGFTSGFEHLTHGKPSLTITTVLSSPYIMEKLDSKAKQRLGNDRYEGFIIDLADQISSIVGFNYTIKVTNGYGSVNAEGQWNGMIKDLLDETADMAMADLSISYEREQVVDFTMPFLDLGISLLYVKAPSKSVNIFGFLAPLSLNVWLLMILGGLMVSLSMYIIARISPYETEELHQENDGQTPFSSFRHCLWFSVASWVQQGCDFLPRAISGRFVASIWWFFTLIMISSYTANLAAFLTVERMEVPISSASDLASQSKILYGCVATGSTAAFFRNSNNPTYSKMWRTMERHKDEVMMAGNKEGLEQVLQEDGAYAFFMESTSIEYTVERNCQLQQIGGLLDSKSYGIALPHGSPLRARLSDAIIKLNEDGLIRDLKEKWWKKERGGGACQEDVDSSTVSELNLMNVGGIFLVLTLGLIIGTLLAFVERYWMICCQRRKT